MPNAVIERLQQERTQIEQATASILDSIENRDLSKAELDTVSRSKERIAEIDGQLAPLLAFEESRSAAEALTKRISSTKVIVPSAETRSIGAEFAGSDQFRSYRYAGRSGFFEARALPTDLGDIAALLPKASTQVDITSPIQSPLLELLRAVPVSQNVIDTIVWARGATGAAVVAEGGTKPLIEFTPAVVTKALDTIAGATQITRQMAEDAPTVAAYINGLLVDEVRKKAESEAATALAAATITGVTGADLLSGIRVAVGEVQAAGYNPNAVLLNPADWAEIDLSVTSTTLNGPVVGYNFWGLRPVAANSQPAGTATVGDFTAGVQRYIRSGTSVYITDSHASTFLENVFTILAETRQKTVVTRPGALREVTVGAAATAAASRKKPSDA